MSDAHLDSGAIEIEVGLYPGGDDFLVWCKRPGEAVEFLAEFAEAIEHGEAITGLDEVEAIGGGPLFAFLNDVSFAILEFGEEVSPSGFEVDPDGDVADVPVAGFCFISRFIAFEFFKAVIEGLEGVIEFAGPGGHCRDEGDGEGGIEKFHGVELAFPGVTARKKLLDSRAEGGGEPF